MLLNIFKRSGFETNMREKQVVKIQVFSQNTIPAWYLSSPMYFGDQESIARGKELLPGWILPSA